MGGCQITPHSSAHPAYGVGSFNPILTFPLEVIRGRDSSRTGCVLFFWFAHTGCIRW